MLDPWAVKNSRWKKRIAYFMYEGRHLRTTNCLRALCASEARAIRLLGLKTPIAIIPNGIHLPTLEETKTAENIARTSQTGDPICDPTSRIAALKTDGLKILLYLGRLHPKKGLVNLLRAWAEVQKTAGKQGQWVLVIAGWNQGRYEDDLKQLATDLGLSWEDVSKSRPLATLSPSPASKLLFLGPQFNEAKAACYTCCDAFILPSLSEGLPMVVLEAWVYGKPVLMTPECNLPEGFTAPAAIRIEGSTDSIVNGLGVLLRSSSADLRGLGDRGRTLAGEKFTWPAIARQMSEVYTWMLGGGSRPQCVIDD